MSDWRSSLRRSDTETGKKRKMIKTNMVENRKRHGPMIVAVEGKADITKP